VDVTHRVWITGNQHGSILFYHDAQGLGLSSSPRSSWPLQFHLKRICKAEKYGQSKVPKGGWYAPFISPPSDLLIVLGYTLLEQIGGGGFATCVKISLWIYVPKLFKAFSKLPA